MTDPVLERLWEKVQQVQSNECWMWTGSLNHNGYPEFHLEGKTIRAHRFTFQVNKGSIPEGMELDHLCRNRTCVNPDHLEVVTSRENNLRSDTASTINARKTHCPKGHPLSGNNLINRSNRNTRECKECHRIQESSRLEKKDDEQ